MKNMANNDTTIPVSYEVAIFAAVMTSIFSFVGTIANLCTIIALLRSPKLLKEATTKFIFSLALCDFLMCCLVFPPTAQQHTIENLGYPAIIHDMCPYFKYLEYNLFSTSILHLMAISINRYIKICQEKVYDQIYSSRNVSIMIGLIWLFCFGFGLLPLFGIWGQFGKYIKNNIHDKLISKLFRLNLTIHIGFDSRKYYCLLEPKNEKSPRMFITILYMVIPIICIVGCYSAIFLKVREEQKSLQRKQNSLRKLQSQSGSDKMMKIITEQTDKIMISIDEQFRMIFVITACFIFLIIPMIIVGFIIRTISSFSELANVDKVVYGLVSANFVVNPFIYFFMNKNYREAFTKLVPEKLKNIRRANGQAPQPKHGIGNTMNEAFMLDEV